MIAFCENGQVKFEFPESLINTFHSTQIRFMFALFEMTGSFVASTNVCNWFKSYSIIRCCLQKILLFCHCMKQQKGVEKVKTCNFWCRRLTCCRFAVWGVRVEGRLMAVFKSKWMQRFLKCLDYSVAWTIGFL